MRACLLVARQKFTERKIRSVGLLRVFLTDPSGVTIELNYPAVEAIEDEGATAALSAV
jgi:hypothetical protein